MKAIILCVACTVAIIGAVTTNTTVAAVGISFAISLFGCMFSDKLIKLVRP